jgi:hypothetical protein
MVKELRKIASTCQTFDIFLFLSQLFQKSIPKLSQNLALDTTSASDLQQAQPVRKQAMFKNMADGRSYEDEDAGCVQSQILRQFRY